MDKFEVDFILKTMVKNQLKILFLVWASRCGLKF